MKGMILFVFREWVGTQYFSPTVKDHFRIYMGLPGTTTRICKTITREAEAGGL